MGWQGVGVQEEAAGAVTWEGGEQGLSTGPEGDSLGTPELLSPSLDLMAPNPGATGRRHLSQLLS